MTRIDVPAAWVASGQLGPLCARHGMPRTHQQKRAFYTSPPLWSYLLLFLGILPLLLALLALRRTVKGSLPVCARCPRDRRRYLGFVAGAWVATVGCFVAAAEVADALAVLAMLLLLGTLLLCLAGDRFRVRGVFSRDQLTVRLAGVDQGFAAALQAAMNSASQPVPHGDLGRWVPQPSDGRFRPAPQAPTGQPSP